MPREPTSKYFWPASGLTESEMGLLFLARESSSVRVPITKLIARAVRQAYGHLAEAPVDIHLDEQLKEAA
mgnify:CR=1 FL=1|jgi:hypothetical protein